MVSRKLWRRRSLAPSRRDLPTLWDLYEVRKLDIRPIRQITASLLVRETISLVRQNLECLTRERKMPMGINRNVNC